MTYMIGAFSIRPHPKAPLYDNQQTAQAFFQQILSEVQSSNFNPNDEAFELIKQTCYVSLWFFLRCICSYNGPFERLSDSLSIDMCNERQSDAWENPGAYAAAFIPRNFFKSTVFTTGGGGWDILRNPDERIAIINGIYDKAVSFMNVISNMFSPSSLVGFFFPEYCAFSGKAGKSTEKELVMPNRTRSFAEPTIKPFGVSGAAEGGHFTRLSLDDLVGLDSLNASRESSANMEAAKKWLGTNLTALRDGVRSRVGLCATRYGIDDCYQNCYESVKEVHGYTDGDLQATSGGKWSVYYRMVEENGFYLRPDVMNKESLEELVRTDFWAAMTQWYNSPYKTGLAEFVEASVGLCRLVFNKNEWWIVRVGDNISDKTVVRLGDCDVVMTIDPAATDKGIKAKTCRSSIGIWACDSDDNKYRIWSRVGFFSIHELIDHVFEGNRVFNGYVRATFVESNAFQKVLKPLFDAEQLNRKAYVHTIAVQATGDKKARIRVAFGTYLTRNAIWATSEAGKEMIEELRMFPMSESKMDVLDESEKGIVFSQRPDSPQTRAERLDEEEMRSVQLAEQGSFGY